ncbi:PAS domain-containing sensor histidine kinase [Halorientalis salina]|uniref:PAS domain-containing sensor histidine kinase n=1 Tax=Halorientalis salina TaxID=2932266 RepID=UPI0010ACB0A6|nr:PAS domain-containing sensor histidine kinase [Halorientalis salina]
MMSQGAGEGGELHHLLAELPVLSVLTRTEAGEPVVDGCNRQFADRLGYDRSQVVGRPLAELYTPASAAVLQDGGYERALAGAFGTADRELLCADGTVVLTRMRAVPRTDGDGTVIGTRALFVDVTAREQRRQQVAVLNRLLRHNLRNDMTVVLNHASMLADRLDDAQRDPIEHIRETAQRWDRLVGKVQSIRQVVSAETDWQRADLARTLDRVEAQLNEHYPDARIRVLRPSEGIASIRPEIELALVELCENAIHHAAETAPEVVVTVGTPPDEPWIKLTVANDGPAIPESELLALGSDETTPLLHGTGLGLWLVRLAVDRVGGDVSVVENTDAGTAVTIRYPDT